MSIDTHAPLPKTPERAARYREWSKEYVQGIRDMWEANGEDVDSERGREALALVAKDLEVDSRPEWMSVGMAIATIVADGTGGVMEGEHRLDYLDAMRTAHAIEHDEWVKSCAEVMGLSAGTLTSTYEGMDAADDDTKLYRHYDADGVLLYVGITSNVEKRNAQHRRRSKWAALSDTVTVDVLESGQDARDAERQAISTELPLFNVNELPAGARGRAVDYMLDRMADALT